MESTKQVASMLISNGFSVIPVNDSKRPQIPWKEYQSRIMNEHEVNKHFELSPSIGMVCGQISEGLEVMDFDLKYDHTGKLWDNFMSELDILYPDLFKLISESVVTTKNKGKHIYYRCKEIEGNQVLAKGHDNHPLIETRGEGGYVVAPPSIGYSWDSNKMNVHEIYPDEREALYDLARKFNQKEQASAIKAEVNSYDQTVTPWNEFNSQTSNVDLLQSYGWTVVKSDKERTYLKRPGDTSADYSGNVLHSSGLFFCHSTSTELPSGEGLTPHAVLTYLKFGGDFSQSSSYLFNQGFGSKSTNAPVVKDQRLDTNEIIRELEKCRVYTGMTLTKPVPIIAIKGETISTAGNLTGIIGASKAGKSAIIQAGLAGCFNSEGKECDTLGLEVLPSDGKLVLHFDTEQSIYDHHRGLKSALKRGGLETEPKYFKSFNITGRDVSWCKEALTSAGNYYGNQFGGIHSIWLDGPADFLTSVNDEKESNAFVLDLLMFARHHQCPVISTLHFNPDSNTKGRGHLGSAFERKCQSVISVTKSEPDGVSKYEPLKGLLRSSGGVQPFTFQYSVQDGYHVSRGFTLNKKEAERQEQFDDMWNLFDGGSVSHTYSELVSLVMNLYDIKNNSAKKRITALTKRGTIEKLYEIGSKTPKYQLKGGKVERGGF